MHEEEHKKYVKSVVEILNRFNITEKEFYERNGASIFNSNNYGSPNFVIAYGDEENYTEVLYFDGDDGRAIIKNNCEIFEDEGCQIKLHECGYCDFEMRTLKEIINILEEEEEVY